MEYIRYMKLKNWNRFIESVELNFQGEFDTIRELCGPFLKEMETMKGDPDILFRGMKNHLYSVGIGDRMRCEKLSDRLYKYPSRKDRLPTDTNEVLTGIMDDYSKERFGFKMRSEGTFVTKRSRVANDYGGAFVFFPVGDYKYVWSYLVDDFYTYVVDESWYFDINEHGREKSDNGVTYTEDEWFRRPEIRKEVIRYMDRYVDGGPNNPTMDAVSKEEISFYCEEYLIFDIDVSYVTDEFGFTHYVHDV
jgi:hypothetical protein